MTHSLAARTAPMDRRKAGWIAISIAGHAFVLALLAVQAGRPPQNGSAQAPLVYLDIEPRLVRPDDPVRKPTAASRQIEARQAAARGAVSPVAPPANAPAPLRPRLAAPAPASSPSPPADPWQVRREDLGDAVARSLRAGIPGCRTPDILSATERAECERRFGDAAALAAPIEGTGNARRDARFAREGARALAEYEARRRPLAGGVGVVGPADCVGSNFGTGCAGAHLGDVPGMDMRQGAQSVINPSQRPDSGD